ncbi:MAG: cryptochrome/photolyase family protein, partial [Chloroflexota bacterium]
ISNRLDFCDGCRYDPKQRFGESACPFNALYLHFMIRNDERLRRNPRSGPAVLGVAKLTLEDRNALVARAEELRARWSS